MALIQLKDVWEMYRIKFILDGKASLENFWALRGVNLEIVKGEIVGVLGENGAGKSTLLKLIAGMLEPDRGELAVSGKVSGLLELGAGFQPELTGLENAYLGASLFGLTREEAAEKIPGIIEFSDLGKFIHAPVKCFSQGMFVRLAFAIAINIDPDILLIDDTLAVGDEYFQGRCLKKIFELKDRGKTIIFVTHDVQLLRRLCQRVIFLKEGHVVKDGPVDEVVPLYSQTIGDRQGVGMLEAGNVKAIFNNGRLSLNWQDRLITPDPGLCAVFMAEGRWYKSIQAEWKVVKVGEDRLTATGKFHGLDVTQIWGITLNRGGGLLWDIEMESDNSFVIQEGRIDLPLSLGYTRWFTDRESGDFPDIDAKDKKWRAFLEGNPWRHYMGVKETVSDNIKNPALVIKLDRSFQKASAQICNTDYLLGGRVLQYTISGWEDDATGASRRFLFFSGEIICGIPDLDAYLNTIEDEWALSKGPLKLAFDEGKWIINYDGRDVTKGKHIEMSICADGKWYHSSFAFWDIKKQGGQKIIANAVWPGLFLTHIWEIEITSDHSILWNISMQVEKEIRIDEQSFILSGAGDYTHWRSEFGEGTFPDIFLETARDMVQRCVPRGPVSLISQNSIVPALSIGFSNELRQFAKILNSDFYDKSRILRIEKVYAERNLVLPPGRYPCFELETGLGEAPPLCPQKTGILQSEKCRFVFDNGRGRLYWEKMELTKKLGLYTSLRSGGSWHDSISSAMWRIEQQDAGFIRAAGEWLYLPIQQFWEIRLEEDGVIRFQVNMKVSRDVDVDRLQTNVMLSELYGRWMKEGQNHPFPVFQEDADDDWDIVCPGREGDGYIGVAGNEADGLCLPSVALFPEEADRNYSLNIVNSDIYHRGRVLQAADSRDRILSPGGYLCFKGCLRIGR